MTRIIVTASLGLILFVAGLAGSWFVTRTDQAAEADFDELVPSKAMDQEDPELSQRPDKVPTAIRQQPLSAEEVFRYTAMFRDQQQAIDQQRENLAQRQQRLRLMEEDLTRARAELDGLREQAIDVLQQGEQMLVTLTEAKANMEKERAGMESTIKEFEESQMEIDRSEQENLRKISGWFQGMPSDKAATYLQQLANEGKLSSAVQLLQNLEERNAAKILASIPDAGLVVQLTEEFKATRRPTKDR